MQDAPEWVSGSNKIGLQEKPLNQAVWGAGELGQGSFVGL